MLGRILAAKTVTVPSLSLKPLQPNNALLFGQTFSDHMLTIDWHLATGWAAPTITKYKNLELAPSSTVFHYGVECFEGMKVISDST
jgi:branched-chain amino acid aminotransferase